MEKTAVDYLIKEFSEILGPIDTKPMQDLLMMDAMKRAKKMFEQQIIDAHGVKTESINQDQSKIVTGNQYYSQTYKQD